MHANSSAARLGWPGRRAKASAGRRTVFPKCGAAFQGPGAFEGGRTKIERGRTRIEGGAQASKGGAAPRYVALANSLRLKLHCNNSSVYNQIFIQWEFSRLRNNGMASMFLYTIVNMYNYMYLLGAQLVLDI